MRRKNSSIIEFGDFQTPTYIANSICEFLAEQGLNPCSVLEPTCGKGNLLLAALEHFPTVIKAIGVDINPHYIEHLETQLAGQKYSGVAEVSVGDFFAVNWREILAHLPEPILIVGNPPWVTNAELSVLGSENLPPKTNFRGLAGFSAKTGQSNFDISEWMLIHILELAGRKKATLAMLCKTSVARRVLVYAWKEGLRLQSASMYRIDAQKAFHASVDACLLVCNISGGEHDAICRVYDQLSPDAHEMTFGFRDDRLIANVEFYERWRRLEGQGYYRWRSGVKHDAVKVMELRWIGGQYTNKFGESFDLESFYLYPMLKGSEVAGYAEPLPTRWMLVTQRYIGENTASIESRSPKTWAYLHKYTEVLDKRKSSVYKNHPRFSIFGVGEYTFTPWKVAISGLYKKLHFAVVGPFEGKPVVLDDTCYFISCQSGEEARLLARLLNSEAARQFLESFIFWDAKRPITIDILKRLDLVALARELGEEAAILRFIQARGTIVTQPQQLSIWDPSLTSAGTRPG